MNYLYAIILILFLAGIVYGLYLRFRLHLLSWYAGFPPPKYRIKESRNVYVEMKDGIKLAADIYIPQGEENYPVIIARTPYDKNSHPYDYLAELMASQGYVFLIQDVRGKYASGGYFIPYSHEGSDGDTTIGWAAKQPWSNGKIGLFGYSYSGTCAWLTTARGNPALKTLVSMFTTQDTYFTWYDNGVAHIKGILHWIAKYHKRETYDFSEGAIEKTVAELPLDQLDKKLVGYHISTYQEYLDHITPDNFWKQISVDDRSEIFKIPTLIIAGWYDRFLDGSIADFYRLTANTQLIIGPYSHDPTFVFKEIDYGKFIDFKRQLLITLKWYNKWLKDEKVEEEGDIVDYFLMGSNEWKRAAGWPPGEVEYEEFHLTDRGLIQQKQGIESRAQFVYDPEDPVPSIGTHALYGSGWEGPKEQTILTSRRDVVTFRSPILEEDMVITGPSKLVLYVSSSAPDTDFVVKLSDVHPNGTSYYLQSGFLRMRFRDGLDKVVMMKPNEVYKIELKIGHTANTFKKGHKIQIMICSSEFPGHNRNLNTGESNEHTHRIQKAFQKIYYGGQYDSCLILPVFKK
jgi:putative CocE/NonD family hydrolase